MNHETGNISTSGQLASVLGRNAPLLLLAACARLLTARRTGLCLFLVAAVNTPKGACMSTLKRRQFTLTPRNLQNPVRRAVNSRARAANKGRRALRPDTEANYPDFEVFRPYLTMLLRTQWDDRLSRFVDGEDLVQQTFREALDKRAELCALTENQLAGWLRTALVHNLLDARDKYLGKTGERSVQVAAMSAAMEDSASRLENWLAADQSSPSERAAKSEQLRRVEQCLGRLLPAQRETVILHHLRGLSLAEVARQLNRTEHSVAGLLRRGLANLRLLLDAGK
jgi:RNA polymerase sigma-70 factor (ECF subfamily)